MTGLIFLLVDTINTALLLVGCDHVTLMLASDWSGVVWVWWYISALSTVDALPFSFL